MSTQRGLKIGLAERGMIGRKGEVEEYTVSFSTGVEMGVDLVIIIIIITGAQSSPEISAHPISLHLSLDWLEEQASVI